MASYSRADGVRGIIGEAGYGWVPGDGGAWTHQAGEGPVYVLEKRPRNLKDGAPDTGWYLYDDQTGGFFGEWCSRRILDAVDAANDLIYRD